MTTLEKLEKGIFKLDEFDEQQKTFITALVKMSFIDGLQNKANLSDSTEQCSFCGNENVTIECDGVWCTECSTWENRK